jgi:hypothetical protein
MIKSSLGLVGELQATRRTLEFAPRGPEWVFKSPLCPPNFDSPSSSLLTSIYCHQPSVSTCPLAQFLLFLTWISNLQTINCPQHSSNTSQPPFWALQEQFPPPEELLGLRISTSKYFSFVSSILDFLLGILLYYKGPEHQYHPCNPGPDIKGHPENPCSSGPSVNKNY